MRLSVKDLKTLIRESLEEHINEAFNDDEEHISFKQGSIMELIRPVRVNPAEFGGFQGGEDSDAARRGPRPRGTTSSILPPGTQCQILRAGKNEAIVHPFDENGESFYDPQTGLEVDAVKIHINKFCPHCANAYKAGQGQKNILSQLSKAKGTDVTSRMKELEAMRDKVAAELDRLHSMQQMQQAPKQKSADPWVQQQQLKRKKLQDPNPDEELTDPDINL